MLFRSRVCVCLCLCVHTCAFSPLSRLLDLGSCSPGPDSARVRQRRAATKSPDSCLPPSTPQSALLPITPTAEGPAPRQRLRDRWRGAQLCDGCLKVRAPSPRVRPGAPRPGGAGSPSLCPCISAATQNRTEMASRGPEPGSKAALAQVRSLCPTYNAVPASAQQRDSAVRARAHTHAAKSLQSCPTLCDPIEGSLLKYVSPLQVFAL